MGLTSDTTTDPREPRPPIGVAPAGLIRMTMVGVLRVAMVGLALMLLGTGCGGGEMSEGADSAARSSRSTSEPTSSIGMEHPAGSPAPAGTFAVGSTERTYVDDSRPTAAHGGQPELSSRTLRTLVLYPASGTPSDADGAPKPDATALDGPWPLILFAHGSTRKAEDYLPTLMWWASAGYVVVAPNFPLSTEGTPGGTLYTDYPSQSADESFVLDSVFVDRSAPQNLGRLVDSDRVGLGGQSFGAITTLGTATTECCADARVKVATEFAGIFLPYPSGDELAPRASSIPVLFVHGTDDPTLPYGADHDFWQRLGAPGGFLTIVGGAHDDGFFGGGGTPVDKLVSDVTLAFYDAHLKGDTDAMARIQRLVGAAGPQVATFEPSP